MKDLSLHTPVSLSFFSSLVAPSIDFDDYKVFEGVTNDFGLKKNLLFFRGKIIISPCPSSKVSRVRTKDL